MSFRLEGSRVLLTGATGGIGRAIARALHARGAMVELTARRTDVLESLRSELGDRVEVVSADLADPDAVSGLAERPRTVDALVMNAALPASGRLETFSPEEIDRALEVNLRAPLQLTRAFLPGMLERGAGHLVFISSMAGKMANPRSGVYSATKFGLRGFAAALRQDLRGRGVGVTAVFPGFVSEAGLWGDTGLQLPRAVGTRSPEQVARAVVRGIERDRGEIDVAPPLVRAAVRLGGVAPGLAAGIQRRLGAEELAEELAEAQRVKR
jgi:uncharacterized protein